MKIPYPNEIDWFWLATDIVMPLLTWIAVVGLIAMALVSFLRAMRRHEERMIDRLGHQSTDGEAR